MTRVFLLLFLVASLAFGQAGRIDPTFNVLTEAPPGTVGVTRIALQPDGRILVAGYFVNVNGIPRNGVVRLYADGRLDPSFHLELRNGPNNIEPGVSDLALAPDGKIIIYGNFTHIGDVPKKWFARLHSDGRLDESYKAAAYGPYSNIAIDPGGRVVIGGFERAFRINEDGTPDTTFDVTLNKFGSVDAVTIQRDGKILIGGDFFNVNGFYLASVGRLLPDGTVDASFDTSLQNLGEENRVLVELSDGSVLIGGDVIAKLNPNGRLVEGFRTYESNIPAVQAIGLQSDGKIMLTGGYLGGPSPAWSYLWRLLPNGELDTASFSPDERITSPVRTMVLLRDGRLLMGGLGFDFGNGEKRHLVRVLGDSPVLRTKSVQEGITLAWPALYTNFTLQSATTLTTSNWIPLTGSPAILLDSEWVITNRTSELRQFFRLQRSAEPRH